jgi:hypothetical protein
MKFKLVILSALVTVFCATTPIEVVAETLCSKNEHQYFSCGIYGSNKIVSICGNVDLENRNLESFEADEDAYMQYRFGTKNNIELTFPKEKKLSIGKFYGQNIHTHFVSVENINFRIGQYHYSVENSSSSLDDNSSNIFTGIIIYKVGQKIPKKYSCKGDAFFDQNRKRNTYDDFSKIADKLESTNGNGG